MKTYFLIILTLFIVTSCHGQQSDSQFKEDSICGEQISKALGHINNYYFTKQTAYLDSSIQILKSIENKSNKYRNIIYSDEVHAYFLHKNFSLALNALNKVPATVYPFPAFKNILEDKIKAKEAETKGDTINQQHYYNIIISIYHDYIDRNKKLFETELKQSNTEQIMDSQVGTILTEMYYYKIKVEHINKAMTELDNYRKEINGNIAFFEELKKYLKQENGHEISIILQ